MTRRWVQIILGPSILALAHLPACLRVSEGEARPDVSIPAEAALPDTSILEDTGATEASSDSSDTSDSGEDAAPPTCDRYGGLEGVEIIADAVVTNLLADCRVQSSFQAMPKPALDHLRECLALQLGSIWRCSRAGVRVKYPAYDSKGILCRDMKTSHAGKGISAGDVDAFLDVYKKTLIAQKVDAADVAAVAGVLGTTKKDIAESTSSAPTKPTLPCP